MTYAIFNPDNKPIAIGETERGAWERFVIQSGWATVGYAMEEAPLEGYKCRKVDVVERDCMLCTSNIDSACIRTVYLPKDRCVNFSHYTPSSRIVLCEVTK